MRAREGFCKDVFKSFTLFKEIMGIFKKVTTYHMSKTILTKTYKYLNSFGEDEGLCFMTGSKTGQNITLKNIHKPTLEKSSPAGVKADPFSIFDILQQADSDGEIFSGILPTDAYALVENTRPSDIDYKTHADYEEVGFSTIGMIFSKDGYFRFYTRKEPFDIKIYGDPVKIIDKKKFVFKL